MKLWLDNQLSPKLSGWILSTFDVAVGSVASLGLRVADDASIFHALRMSGDVIVTKDDDFQELVLRLGPPPQILWIRSGNISNRAMRALLERTLDDALTLLRSGEPIVEINRQAMP